jgi:glycosyltransferase involved in cell wall biosynthesis
MFSVLAFTIKPRESADSRYRILQYEDLAKQDGVRIEHRSLMDAKYFRWQTKDVHLLTRALLYPVLLACRFWQVLFQAPKYDAVWICREMAPFGPPVLEQLLVRMCKRVILDVDDALHISDKASSRFVPWLLRDTAKFARMAHAYNAVICGSRNLADFYRQYSGNVSVLPTVVDAHRYATITRVHSPVVRIGWIGTPLNVHHLEMMRPALTQLARERSLELVLVGLNQPLDWPLPAVRYLEWNLQEELTFFGHFDIGVMPLEDTDFARGKCAFKLIQYMAAGLPVVASPVGASAEVVQHGANGFLASTDEDWISMLRLLIDDAELREKLGAKGREMVRESYSAQGLWRVYSTIITGVEESKACASSSVS